MDMKESLATIFERHAVHGADQGHADKGSTHSYIETYERLLAPFRDRAELLEIGLALGWSLDMWGEYFGPNSRLVGVDISVVFDRTRFDDRFTIIEADATRPDINGLIEGSFDIIIDDGSHMEADQATTFRLLRDRIKKGGLYIIEDILAPDHSIPRLSRLHDNCEVVDLRKVKGRFDDVLLIYRF